MKRKTTAPLLATVVALLSLACSSVAPPPAKTPTQLKAARDPGSESDRTRGPRHVAPPPAYGNKIVLAAGAGPDSSG